MNSRWILSEQLLRGAFLGLVLGGSTWITQYDQSVCAMLATALPIFFGLAVCMIRRGNQPLFSIAGLLLAMIDAPVLMHVLVPVGILAGMWWIGMPPTMALASLAFGSLVGGAIYSVYRLRSATIRRWGMFLFLAISVGFGMSAAGFGWVDFGSLERPAGLFLLFASGMMYLLLFAGRSEEAELDIGIVALLLALGLAACLVSRTGRGIVVLGPVALYALYCEWARRKMIVFKHVVRGIGHEQNRHWPEALIEYRLALMADPRSSASSAGSWRVHQLIDIDQIGGNNTLLSLIDTTACLDRANHLVSASDRSDKTRLETERLLDLIDRCDKTRVWQTRSVRLKLLSKEGLLDEAISLARPIRNLTTDDFASLSSAELTAVQAIWEMSRQDPLLLSRSEELLREGGTASFLSLMEWLIEKKIRNEGSLAHRPFLYRKLRRSDYEQARATPHKERFPKLDLPSLLEAARSLGAEPESGLLGVELFEIAASENPAGALLYWMEAAEIADRADLGTAVKLRRQIHDVGLSRGVASLASDQRQAFDRAIKHLAQQAESIGDAAESVRLWELYAGSSSSGLQTREKLFRLYEQQGDSLAAIRQVEAILLFDLSPRERSPWIETRNRLYAELDPAGLAARAQESQAFFQFRYCTRRAMQLLERGASENEISHYLQLAELGPIGELRLVNYVLGRMHARAGRVIEAADCFEACCKDPLPASADEEESLAYHRACRLLGEICVEQIDQPRRGIPYLLLFKDHVESGAETLFLLGRGYEKLGDVARARKWYDMVSVYSSHPKVAEAKAALDRLAHS
ncbi:DUF998 domain-containing protein [bacterium]|nr:DUF998 domain-containing protein [bacterium]